MSDLHSQYGLVQFGFLQRSINERSYRSIAKYLKKAVERPKEDLTAVREAVRGIIRRVKEEGEAAVRYYSGKFDNWSPRSFRVS